MLVIDTLRYGFSRAGGKAVLTSLVVFYAALGSISHLPVFHADCEYTQPAVAGCTASCNAAVSVPVDSGDVDVHSDECVLCNWLSSTHLVQEVLNSVSCRAEPCRTTPLHTQCPAEDISYLSAFPRAPPAIG